MPRQGTIASDAVAFLLREGKSASIEELVDGLNEVRRFPVHPHSVRSALYQHLDDRGEALFSRVERGRYELKRPPS